MAEISLRDSDPSLAPLISQVQFDLLLWVFLGLGIIAFSLRISIRVFCLRKILPEDCLMIITLFLYIACAGVIHTFLTDIYTLDRVQKGLESPTSDFIDVMTRALRAQGVVVIVTITGVWTIKLNYLFFFRRLTRQIRVYVTLWWISLVIIVASGIVNISLMPYQCTFSSFAYVVQNCANDATINTASIVTKIGVGLDVATDLILITFPIMILWPTKLRLNQKILLSGFFSLTLLTIGVTVVRGSIFGAQFYKSVSQVTEKVMDFIWNIFWYWVEFSVSFILASLVSFRSLFISRENKAQEKQRRKNVEGQAWHNNIIDSGDKTPKYNVSGSRNKKKTNNLYDSLLETVRGWEGPEIDVERGQYAHRDDYVLLEGITKTVHISQQESHLDRTTSGKSRTTQSALEVYCFHEESTKVHSAATGERKRAQSVAAPKTEVADTKDCAKPEPAYFTQVEL